QKQYVKTKSGFITPVTLRVSRIKSEQASNQLLLGAWFKTETAKKVYVHLICSKDGIITDISASAVTVLNMSLQNIKRSKTLIETIVPNALTDKG
ncbi:hypothetical protein P5E87_15840, partial [Clostridium perfringens]|nr:hypothetical protein [Clostridium perfringens]